MEEINERLTMFNATRYEIDVLRNLDMHYSELSHVDSLSVRKEKGGASDHIVLHRRLSSLSGLSPQA